MANELFPGSMTVMYVNQETSYGATSTVRGAQTFRTISETLTPMEERDYRPDRTGKADHLARFKGRKSAEWELQCLLMTSGGVTVPPDVDYLMQNLFGHRSENTTCLTYAQATANASSICIRRGIKVGGQAGQADFQEHIVGAIVNRGELAWGSQGNNGLATVTFGGLGKYWGFTGNTSIAPASTLNTTSKAVTVANAKVLTPGSAFRIYMNNTAPNFNSSDPGIDTGGGKGIIVNTINYTTKRITYGQILSRTHAGASAMMPYNPTETTAGTPIHARLGFLSINASKTRIDHLGGRITFEDNRTLLNEEVGYDSPSRVLREDRRAVTFSLEFLLKKENMPDILGSMYAASAHSIQVNVGSGTGETIRAKMINTQFDMAAVEIPDQGMLRCTLNGVALGTNGNDSLRLEYV